MVKKPSTASSQESLASISSDDGSGNSDNIRVVVRVKPLSSREVARKDNQTVQFPGNGQILVDDHTNGHSRVFNFNMVFQPEATQENVFQYSGVKRFVEMALDGFSCTIMAYGQTGSGKTYTLTGPQGSEAASSNILGLVNLAFSYLFDEIRQRTTEEYTIHASYLEVYKEHVLDLLNPSTKHLAIRWSKVKGFYAENLFAVECEDEGDLQGVVEEGKKNRQVRSHKMNENSSRSHTLLIITLTSETHDPNDPDTFIRRQGKLSLVDLAGSEKTKKTNSKGEVLVEANNINKSLLVLGNCISALADSKKRNGHIPYRDSCLTKLLSESLSGSGMVLMIACISPSRTNVAETMSTLRYASRAKRIKTKPIVRMDPREQMILSLKREVRLLRMENEYLRQQVVLGNNTTQVAQLPSAENTLTNAEEKGTQQTPNTLIAHYMQENEGLRAENSQLHQLRTLLVRDHEIVCKENERLAKKLADIERGVMRSPLNAGYRPDSILSASMSFGNSGLWMSMGDINREALMAKDDQPRPKSVEDLTKPVSIQDQSLTPGRMKFGQSLTNLPKQLQNSELIEDQIKRCNSWASGIPLPVDRLSKMNEVSKAEKDSGQVQKLPLLGSSKIFAKGNKLSDVRTIGPMKATRPHQSPEEREGNLERGVLRLQEVLRGEA
ncbi:kinesin-like protein KIF12 isoform X2 [Tachypleus tridentatus]|uniref:kinesin-like protein KIF12 isoform X2 n=1 Tax=Tachypleus tridentatus TaxID=6853 RepID=UPI003FD0A88D